MPRTARNAPGGLIYPVLNRANGRLRLFKKEEDFLAFERVMKLAFERFPVQEDEHLLRLLRYVERNPVRPGMVKRAQDWRWGSLHVRQAPKHDLSPLLADWPVDRPANWVRLVNEPQTAAEVDALKQHIQRGRPFGDAQWMERTAQRLGLENTFRSPGRQMGWRKHAEADNEGP